MSDFNKGDFTQQGVDGHVRATLRLNEKRYVELDLTTNEDARGCTISGNVHDRLNNLDYPIGAAPSGNIEITENTAEGSPLNIAQYATATVNVSGGGTYTETFELTKDTTATATEDGGVYYIGLIVGNDFYITPSFDITVNVNDTDISMVHNPGGYWEDNTDNPTYILHLSNNPALMVPAAGNYTVKSISATITGTSLVNCKTTGQHELAFYFTDNNDALYYFYNGAHTVDVDVPIKSITKSQ